MAIERVISDEQFEMEILSLGRLFARLPTAKEGVFDFAGRLLVISPANDKCLHPHCIIEYQGNMM